MRIPANDAVWVVMEEEIERQLVAVGLERDYPVTCFPRHRLALDRLIEGPTPALLVLDLLPPWMASFEALQELTREAAERSVPVIFLTSSGADDFEPAFPPGLLANLLPRPIHSANLRLQVRRCLEQRMRVTRLESLAGEDPLTGLANRRRFDESCAREWSRAARSRDPITLFLIDLDCFKALNDRYGHAAGDRALRSVADALVRRLRRPGDLVARIGGEEYAVLLPQTDMAGARALAALVLRSISDLRIENLGSTVAEYLTASLGFATVIAGRGRSLEAALEAADRALYRAKREGRNTARSAPLALVPDESEENREDARIPGEPEIRVRGKSCSAVV